MAYVFNQEWAEPLTQQEAVVVGIGLLLTDNLSWKDGVSFLKDATHNLNSGLTSQALISEALPMAQGDQLVMLLAVQLVLADNVAVTAPGPSGWLDEFSWMAPGNNTTGPAHHYNSFGNVAERLQQFIDAPKIVLIGNLFLTFAESLNFWLDQQTPPIVAEWDIIIGCPHLNNWLDQQVDFAVTPDQFHLSDILTLSDGFSSLLSLPLTETLSDTLTLSDALAVGYGDAVTDTMTMSDQSPTITGEYDLVLGCPHLNNWQDAVTEQLLSAGGLTENLSDTLTMSDALGLGYGEGMVEQLTLSDQSRVGYGFQIADTLTMSDADVAVLGIVKLFADTLTLSDALIIGYGGGIFETLTISDANSLGYGFQITDTLTLTDGFIIEEFGGSFIYELAVGPIVVATGTAGNESMTLTDALASQLGLVAAFSDTLSLSDALGIGYGEGLVEQLTLSDTSGVGYGFQITDILTLSDKLAIGYGDLLTDTLTMSDAVNEFLNQPNLTETFSDTLTLSDSLILGYGDQITDSLTLSDQLGVGYGDAVNDTLTLTDAYLPAFGLTENLSGTLAMSDALGVGYGEGIVEQLTFSDQSLVGYGFQITDTLTLSDALIVGYGNLVNDALTLSDAFSIQPGLIELLSDTMTQSDSDQLGYGLSIPEQLVQTDALLLGYGDLIAEPLTLSDALLIGYGDLTTDQLVLTDAFAEAAGGSIISEALSDQLTLSDGLAIGYGDRVTDQLVMSDQSPTITTEWDIVIGCPHLNNWQDAAKVLKGLLENLSDTMTMSDAFKMGQQVGNITDVMTLSDGLMIGYGDALTDALALSDSFGFSANVIGQQLSDILTLLDAVAIFVTVPVFADDMIMSDAFAYTLANATILSKTFADTLTLSDKLRIGYGLAVSPDQLAQTDAVAEFLSTSNLPEVLVDTLTMLDQLDHIGYGFQISEFIRGRIQLALDGFNRPNENPINTNWKPTLHQHTLMGQVINDQLIGQNGTGSLDFVVDMIYNGGIPWPENQYAQITLIDLVASTDSTWRLSVKSHVSTNGIDGDSYSLLVDEGSSGGIGAPNTASIIKTVNSSTIFLTPSVSITPEAGDVFRLEFASGVLTAFQNDAPIPGLTAQDNSIVGGFPGVTISLVSQLGTASNVVFDDFSAGEVVGLNDGLEIGYGLLPVELQIQEIQLAQDTFNRANENPLNPAVWQAITPLAPLQISSNSCESTVISGSGSGEAYVGIPWTKDQAASVVLAASAVGGNFDIFLRSGVDLGTNTVFGYDFGFTDNGDGTLDAFLAIASVGGGTQTLWEQKSLPFNDGDVFLGVAIGETLALYQNGQMVSWINDTTYVSGGVELQIFAPAALTDMQLTNFVAYLPTSVLSDQLLLGVGSTFADSLVMSDASAVGYGELVADSLVLSDAIAFGQLGLLLALSDQLTLLDAFGGIQFPIFVDQMVQSDRLAGIGYGDSLVDQLVLSEHLTLALFGTTISMFPSDQLTQTDSLQIGYGDSVTDQMVLSERFVAGLVLAFTDQITATDQLATGPGMTVTDQMATQADAFKFTEGMVVLISEASMVQLDSLAALFAYGLQVNDVVLFREQMTLLYGMIFAGDQMALADSFATPSLQTLIELALADAEYANWLDSVLEIFVYQPTEITLHSLTVFAELVAGLQVSSEVSAASISVESQLQEVTQPTDDWFPSEEGAFVYDASTGNTYGKILPTPGFQGEVASLFAGVTYNADHYVECTIADWNPGLSFSTPMIGPAARMSFDENGLISCYVMEVRYDGVYQLVWQTGVKPGEIFGPNTQRGLLVPPSVGPGVAAGNVLRIEVRGNQVTGLVNGQILFGPVTDTRLSQGNPGMEAYPEDVAIAGAIQVSNFVTGTLPNGQPQAVSFAGIGDLVKV
jgi:hypothetical protein